MLRIIQNLFSPPLCISCYRGLGLLAKGQICMDCFNRAERLETVRTCSVCGKPVPPHSDDPCRFCKTTKTYYIRAVSRYKYKGSIKDAICNMKFQKQQWICYPLGTYLAATVQQAYGDIAFDGIICVPATPQRLLERGFNQSRELAVAVSEQLKLPLLDGILFKKREAAVQSSLTHAERIQNVKGAFYVRNAEKLYDKNILLIDDVMTTGATVNECAKTLRRAGALCVYAATVATVSLDA